MTARTRYALVGTGGRAKMFIDAILGPYREHAELVGLCDLSQVRMDWHNRKLTARYGVAPRPTYRVTSDDARAFDRMLSETRPDTVIVTSMDCTHHTYIARAMDLGCDVISEKPMTIDLEKLRAIFDAIARTGKRLTVTFNYRYGPGATKLRELVMQGAVGRPLQVDFSWVLDVRHGADYFRRWHREKDKSGGLLVHKATHHFDLVNWWIDSYPAQVFAMGELKFYGRANAEARGARYAYARYTGAPEAAGDPFALDLSADETLRGLYLDAEAETGYLRDRNVFGDNITIEDTMHLMARYRNGVMLSYSLIAYCPWEGYRVAITGDAGRVELDVNEGGAVFIAGQEEARRLEAVNAMIKGERITVYPQWGTPFDAPIPSAEGGHGGADPVMLEHIFSPNPPPDPFNRAASHIDGAASILMGISANRSLATGALVNVADLFQLPDK